LTSRPQIGIKPQAAGRAKCLSQQDGSASINGAVLLHGKASVTIDNGAVGCIGGTAIWLESSGNGAPSLSMNGTTIEDAQVGLHALAGTATIARSSFQYNAIGVEQDTDSVNVASIDLSGGAAGGVNTIACNTSGNVGDAGMPGASVLNLTSNVLNASNVDWDTPGPDQFSCNATLLVCTCESGGCTTAPGTDGMDVVTESSGMVLTAGNGRAPTCVP
jgi:hypothetical protein